MTRVDPALVADYTAGVARARLEYQLLPSVTGRSLDAPCVNGCGRTARTHRGVCRTCTTAAKKKSDPTKENRP